MIELLNTSAAKLIESRVDPVQLVHADPPWAYRNRQEGSVASEKAFQYESMTIADIAADVDAAFDVAADDCYLALWSTFPTLFEWFEGSRDLRWTYISGATWHKRGQLGVGYHFRGDSELLLLYKKGKPKPNGGSKSNHWSEKNRGHSIKPRVALKHLIEMATKPGETVLELYAGASASMALCCRELVRSYLGAELDAERHNEALIHLSQRDLFEPAAHDG